MKKNDFFKALTLSVILGSVSCTDDVLSDSMKDSGLLSPSNEFREEGLDLSDSDTSVEENPEVQKEDKENEETKKEGFFQSKITQVKDKINQAKDKAKETKDGVINYINPWGAKSSPEEKPSEVKEETPKDSVSADEKNLNPSDISEPIKTPDDFVIPSKGIIEMVKDKCNDFKDKVSSFFVGSSSPEEETKEEVPVVDSSEENTPLEEKETSKEQVA